MPFYIYRHGVVPESDAGTASGSVGFREPSGSRGLPSLAVLTIISGVFGWLMMRNSTSHGADFVVLSMFFGITFAFA